MKADLKNGEASFACTVKGLKPGKATVTVKPAENDKVSSSIEIIVLDPRHDYATPLKDNSGNQVYIYDKASKTYKEAHVAD